MSESLLQKKSIEYEETIKTDVKLISYVYFI